jgi:predicted nuclease of predicted toxin-antitoxin system
MHLLTGENVPLPVVSALREKGHDVSWIGAVEPGIDDRAVLRRARGEERLLIAFDKDFGTLIFQKDGSRPVGILLFRLPPLSKDELVQFMVETIADRSDWKGHFAVIEHDRIRMRPLAESSS